MISSQVQIEVDTDIVQASEVFQTETSLIEKLKKLDYNQNLNIFLLEFDNSEEILVDIVDYLIKANQMVFVKSFTHIYNEAQQTYSKPIYNMLPDQKEDEYYLVLFIKRFIMYYKKYVTKQYQETPEHFTILNFLVLSNENQLLQYNIIVTTTAYSSDIVTNVAQNLHCFDWNEMNRYQQIINNKSDMQDTNDFALILNDERFSTDSNDPLLELKRLIVNFKSYYIQQLQDEGNDNNISMISKMTMLRHTHFNFKPSHNLVSIYVNGQQTMQMQFVENIVYFAQTTERVDQIFIRQQTLQAPKSVVNRETRQFIKKLPDDVTITQMLEQSQTNTHMISSNILYNTTTLNDADKEAKLQYVNQLILRNQRLIKDMYQRLQNSEQLLKQVQDDEKQIQNMEIKRFEQALGYVNNKKKMMDQSFQIADLSDGSSSLNKDIYLKQLQITQQYNETLNELCYINQLIEQTEVNDYEQLKELLTTVTSMTRPCKRVVNLNSELGSLSIKQIQTRLQNIKKQNFVLRNKLAQFNEQVRLQPSILQNKKTKLSQMQQKREQNDKELKDTNFGLELCQKKEELRGYVLQLKKTVESFNLPERLQEFSNEERKCYYALRGVADLSKQLVNTEFYTQDKELRTLFQEVAVEAKHFNKYFGDFGLQRLNESIQKFESEL